MELRSRNSNASLDKERKIGYVGLCRSPSKIRPHRKWPVDPGILSYKFLKYVFTQAGSPAMSTYCSIVQESKQLLIVSAPFFCGTWFLF